MLDTLRNDVHFAGLQLYRVVSHFDLEDTAQNKEEVIGVSVAVTHEFAFDFNDHEVMPVEQADGSWTPVFSERIQFRCEVDDLVLHFVDGLDCADGGGSERIQLKCSFQRLSIKPRCACVLPLLADLLNFAPPLCEALH